MSSHDVSVTLTMRRISSKALSFLFSSHRYLVANVAYKISVLCLVCERICTVCVCLNTCLDVHVFPVSMCVFVSILYVCVEHMCVFASILYVCVEHMCVFVSILHVCVEPMCVAGRSGIPSVMAS